MQDELAAIDVQYGFKKWEAHHIALRDEYNLPDRYDGWTSQEDIRMQGVPASLRMRDLANLSWGHVPKRERNRGKTGLLTNLSQCGSRKPWKVADEDLGTLCTTTLWYAHDQDAVILPTWLLNLLGLPMELDYSGRSLADLRRARRRCICGSILAQ